MKIALLAYCIVLVTGLCLGQEKSRIPSRPIWLRISVEEYEGRTPLPAPGACPEETFSDHKPEKIVLSQTLQIDNDGAVCQETVFGPFILDVACKFAVKNSSENGSSNVIVAAQGSVGMFGGGQKAAAATVRQHLSFQRFEASLQERRRVAHALIADTLYFVYFEFSDKRPHCEDFKGYGSQQQDGAVTQETAPNAAP